MDSFKIKQGSRLDLQVVTEVEDAVSATIVMRKDSELEEFTESFVDLVADFQDSAISDLELGEWEYQININYVSGSPDKYPDASNCEDGCDFPTITVCESLDEESSS